MALYCRRFVAPLFSVLRDRRNTICFNLFNGFCNLGESPDLPDWFKPLKGEGSYAEDSEDDFVLPTKLESLEIKGNSLNNRQHKVRIPNPDIGEQDVETISSVLKNKFVSPHEVICAFNGSSVMVSKNLVDKILKRFSNDWIPAFGFFKWADTQIGYIHSPESYDVMVDILGKCKEFELMWGLVEEMVQLGSLVSLHTMAKIMRRLAGAGRWGDAIRTFHNLELFGVKKDTLAMNILLDTLCKERSVKHASDAFLELRSQIPPNASSFNALIHGWCKARKIDEARRTMEEMREFGLCPCVISYTSLIEAYCMEKNFMMVDALLHEMHAQGCFPNVVTYTIIMHSLGKAKKTQEALNILERMKMDGIHPDASFYNSLIYMLGRVGRLQDAHGMFEEMRSNGILPDVTTYNTMISVYCYHSQEENALKLLHELEESSCKPDIKTYTPLLKLCYKRKWVKILLFLLAHLFRKDISLDLGTYTLLIQGLCRNGKLPQSCLFFEEMVMKGFIPKQQTYDLLLKALEREKMDRAKAKVHNMMLKAQSLKGPCWQSMIEHQTA